MLAYAASNPRPAARTTSPRTFALVVAGHAALLAVVLTARGEMPHPAIFEPTDVTFIDPPKPPPPPAPVPQRPATESRLDNPHPLVPHPPQPAHPLDHGTTTLDPGPTIGPKPIPLSYDPPPLPPVVRKSPRLLTSADELRPPYPDIKRINGEQASLRLALDIGANGRVIAVDPVGAADPTFLDAARRYILRHWRYQPANEGGQAVPSRTVITLRFQLEE